ncbi:MAG: hypothetical protein II563_07860 [Treponema sp.]|nr:hypothetical protein [Treponema sp.]MBQ2552741.1 hypothetical protein [Treponema sp.]MBQ4235230.1 hypothetical protein [Treponema sp.]MBQ5384172.1 hypothetical protein [Treponema sp.]
MKKLIALCTIALIAVGAVFAQTSQESDQKVDISTVVRQLEDSYADFHPTASRVELDLEYTPLTGEVIINYTCMAASFDQGEAMNTIDAILEDFSNENQFTRKPSFVRKDRTRYYKDERGLRMASYRRCVRYDLR